MQTWFPVCSIPEHGQTERILIPHYSAVHLPLQNWNMTSTLHISTHLQLSRSAPSPVSLSFGCAPEWEKKQGRKNKRIMLEWEGAVRQVWWICSYSNINTKKGVKIVLENSLLVQVMWRGSSCGLQEDHHTKNSFLEAFPLMAKAGDTVILQGCGSR